MKTLKIVFTLALCTIIASPLWAQTTGKRNREIVTFEVEIDCDHCVKTIEGNIPFEKGVTDMKIIKDKNQVIITYNPKKTDKSKLIKAFAKIKKEAKEVVNEKPKK